MTKILCVGDIHVSDRAPASATETYTDDIIAMLKWTADYASEQEVDAVVWAGDVFHHKAPSRNSHELVLKMIDVVKYHHQLGVRLLCVTGNHDVSNGIVEKVRERQPLGVLYEAGLEELDGWDRKLPLCGIPWRESWTEEGDAKLAFARWTGHDSEGNYVGFPPEIFALNGGWAQDGTKDWKDNASRALAVTHAPIYPPGEAEKQLFELVPTMGPDGISAAMGNTGYLYYGHIHEDHGVFEVEGVTYANMGAISRGSLHEYNLEREIKVALWTEDGFTEVPVPHKPASEAFRLAEVMEERGSKLSLESFLAEVGSKQLAISSTGSVIEHIRTREDVPAPVKKRAIEILEGVE